MQKALAEVVPELARLIDKRRRIDEKIADLVAGAAEREAAPAPAPGPAAEAPKRRRGWGSAEGPRRLPVRDYECGDCGHAFSSNLEIIDARCPKCMGLHARRHEEPPVTHYRGKKKKNSWKYYTCGACGGGFSSRKPLGAAACPDCGNAESTEYAAAEKQEGSEIST